MQKQFYPLCHNAFPKLLVFKVIIFYGETEFFCLQIHSPIAHKEQLELGQEEATSQEPQSKPPMGLAGTKTPEPATTAAQKANHAEARTDSRARSKPWHLEMRCKGPERSLNHHVKWLLLCLILK